MATHSTTVHGTSADSPITVYRSPVWVLLGFGALLVTLIVYGVLAH